MTMASVSNDTATSDTIAALVGDLAPVRPLRRWQGAALVAGVVAAASVAVGMGMGWRQDVVAGAPHLAMMLRSAALLFIGATAAHAALALAAPTVGRGQAGAGAAVLAMLWPLAGLALWLTGHGGVVARNWASGAECLIVSLTSGALVLAAITGWLRRGAPTDLARAGWLAGLGAGGLGGFAFNLVCPFNDAAYIGVYYGAVLVVAALAGRMIVPRLIRW